VRPVKGRRIDPIAAVTIVQLAKASAVAGTILFGATVGLLAFSTSRPVVVDSIIPSNIGGVIASLVLVVAALVAEWWCVLPPQDPDGEPA
jgi:protein-S-isoprenylcysteine O-methyltransferase Ste14